MNWLKKFMYGRYGGDEFTIFLVVLALINMIIGRIFPKAIIFTPISYVLMVYYLFRIFSKNISKRIMENNKYLMIKNKLLWKFRNKKSNVIELKSYKFFTCPECKQKLRVPRKKGKIIIKCSKCGKEFKGKS